MSYYRYTKENLDMEYKRGFANGRAAQKKEDAEEFLEDLKIIHEYFDVSMEIKKWEKRAKE